MNSTLNVRDAVIAELVELGLGHLLVALQEDFAGVLVDDVVRRDLADDFRRLRPAGD